MPPGPPIVEADSGPPAGKVLLVGWPRVSTDQIAGPTSRMPTAQTSAARRIRAGLVRPRRRPASASAKSRPTRAVTETITSGTTSQSRSEALLSMTTNSTIAPRPIATAPTIRASTASRLR